MIVIIYNDKGILALCLIMIKYRILLTDRCKNNNLSIELQCKEGRTHEKSYCNHIGRYISAFPVNGDGTTKRHIKQLTEVICITIYVLLEQGL